MSRAKFYCLGCEQTIKPSKVQAVPVLHSDTLRLHTKSGSLCGPLVWAAPSLVTSPSRDVVINSLRRASVEAFGVDAAEILIRAVEKGWNVNR